MASEAELRRRAELASFKDELLALRGDALDRCIEFEALPPPPPDEVNLRRAMRYTVGAALIQAFGVGKGQRAKQARRAFLQGEKAPDRD